MAVSAVPPLEPCDTKLAHNGHPPSGTLAITNEVLEVLGREFPRFEVGWSVEPHQFPKDLRILTDTVICPLCPTLLASGFPL